MIGVELNELENEKCECLKGVIEGLTGLFGIVWTGSGKSVLLMVRGLNE